MSGGVIHYSVFHCPHCKERFSSDALVVAHAKGKCMYCDGPVHVNALAALPKTLESQVGGIVIFGFWVLLLWGVSELSGFSITSEILSLPHWLAIVCTIAVLIPGAWLSFYYQRWETRKQVTHAIQQFDSET